MSDEILGADPERLARMYETNSFEYGIRYVDKGEVQYTAVREDIARALVEGYPDWYTLVRRPDVWEDVHE